ncbi:MAG: hypothetical protein ACREHV_00635 [Rhizomicrobium sp.]
MACDQIPPNPNLVIPDVLPLVSMLELFHWYRLNVCGAELTEVRGHRMKFLPENFIHLIKLRTKYGKEPKNARLTIEEICRGQIELRAGRFNAQRARELSWAHLIAREPDRICANWKTDGHSGEAYIKNFGTLREPKYRVLICEIHGTQRRPVTIFPRDHISGKELCTQIWP